MPETDLELLIRSARAAGEIALSYWQGENRVWQKGHDDPVSEADLAVDQFLRTELLSARPGYGWLSEETEDDGSRLSRERVFVVDPIDGTRAFVAGERTWAHSLAIVEAGVPVAAVVFLPARDRLFSSAAGGGAFLNGSRISASVHGNMDGARVLAARPTFHGHHWRGGIPAFERHFRPSLAYRLSLVGEGRFDAMMTLRDSWEWDIAAGALIASEAGAMVTDRTGAALKFNNLRPATAGVVVANPALHAGIMDRLADK